MELVSRIVTVAGDNFSPVAFNSTAKTLGELKMELTSKRIDYEGMDFIAAIQGTKLINNESILPLTGVVNGVETNELFIMLQKTELQVKSGMTRKEGYAALKEMKKNPDLVGKIGNYTIMSDAAIIALVEELSSTPAKKEVSPKVAKAVSNTVSDVAAAKVTTQQKPAKTGAITSPASKEVMAESAPLVDALTKRIQVLEKKIEVLLSDIVVIAEEINSETDGYIDLGTLGDFDSEEVFSGEPDAAVKAVKEEVKSNFSTSDMNSVFGRFKK